MSLTHLQSKFITINRNQCDKSVRSSMQELNTRCTIGTHGEYNTSKTSDFRAGLISDQTKIVRFVCNTNIETNKIYYIHKHIIICYIK